MILSKYILAEEKKAFSEPEVISFQVDDWKILEKFSYRIKEKKHFTDVWEDILDQLNDFTVNQKTDVNLFLTPKTLDNLIQENVLLSTLSHMDLPTKYLIKIYEKNNKNFEGLITVYLRYIENHDTENLLALSKTHHNNFVMAYVCLKIGNECKEVKILYDSITDEKYKKLIKKAKTQSNDTERYFIELFSLK